MNELPTTSYEAVQLEPKKEQGKLLYTSQVPLSRDTLDALEELGEILKCVRKEMIADGYEIVDGVVRKVTAPPNVNVYEQI